MRLTSTQERALHDNQAHLRDGWYAFPVQRPGKKPTPGMNWRDESTNLPGRLHRLTRGRSTNFGIDTGKSGLVVIDEDAPGEFVRFCADKGRPFPATYTVATANGHHFYFTAPSGTPIGNVGVFNKHGYHVDVRGEGGYVVAPGSLHSDGIVYEPLDPDADVADLPGWLADFLRAPAPASGTDVPPSNPAPESTGAAAETKPSDADPYERAAIEGELKRLQELDRTWHAGAHWDDTTFAVACTLFELANATWTAITPARVESLVHQHAPTDVTWNSRDVQAKIESAKKTTANKSRPKPEGLVTNGDTIPKYRSRDEVSLQDSLLAEWTAEKMRARYCWANGMGWMKYNGKVWTEATEVSVVDAVRRLFKELHKAELDTSPSTDRLKALNILHNAGKIRTVAGLVKGMVEVRADEFDRAKDLLNCSNGVLDLTTGEMRKHDPALRFTKITKVDHLPDARHSDWDTVLQAVPDDVQDWLQTKFGQAITGHASNDDVLPVLQGLGANGKSTLLAGISRALGDYAVVVPERVLLANPSDHPTELTTLQGARLAVIEETPEDKHLNVKRLKDLLGTDTITARRIRQDNVTWEATHSLFLATNYPPEVKETDHGTWRRLALVAFPYTFRGPHEALVGDRDRRGDLNLGERIKSNREGQLEAVLAWLVAGARRWYDANRQFPDRPARVVRDTAEWRARTDFITGWMDERVEFDPDCKVLSPELHEDFNAWLRDRGQAVWGDQRFSARLEGHSEVASRGVKKTRTTNFQGLTRPSGRVDSRDVTGKQTVWVGLRFVAPERGAQGALGEEF